MIRIRYAELPEGLHVQARASGRRTTIYLRPGLTPSQRRESLRRALRSSRMGYGPPLTAAGLGVAVATARVRATLATAVAAVRWHPLGSVAAMAAFAGLIACYTVLASVSIRIMPGPGLQAEVPIPGLGHPVAWPALPGRGSGPARRHGPARVPGRGGPSPAGRTPSPRQSDPGPEPSPAGTPPSPAPSPSQPGPSPGPSSPAPSPSPSVCLHVGPIGVCL